MRTVILPNRAQFHRFTGKLLELGSIELPVRFARIVSGVACVIKPFVAEELEQGHLYEIPLTEPIPPHKVGPVTLRDMPLSGPPGSSFNC
jgi:hypothetical protein